MVLKEFPIAHEWTSSVTRLFFLSSHVSRFCDECRRIGSDGQPRAAVRYTERVAMAGSVRAAPEEGPNTATWPTSNNANMPTGV